MSAQRNYTIVVPVFNVQPVYLYECLKSVQRAGRLYGWRNVELVVADDGSANVNALQYERIILGFNRSGMAIIYLRHERNQGIAATRAAGVDAGSAEWLLLLDSDDLVDPSLFDRLSEFSNGTVLAYTAHRKVNEALDTTIETRRKKRYQELLEKHAGTSRDPFLHYTFLIHMHVIRREAYYAVGGFDKSIPYGDEIDFHLRLTERFRDPSHYHYIDQILYIYRDNSSGVCRDLERYASLISNIESTLLRHARQRGIIADWCRRVGKEPDGAVSYEYGLKSAKAPDA